MTIRSSIWLTMIAFVGVAPLQAYAQCEVGDLVCKKFGTGKPAAKPKRRRTKVTHRRNHKSNAQAVQRSRAAEKVASTRIVTAAPVVKSAIETKINVSNARALSTVSRLLPGTIAQAPGDVANLVFEAGDQIETVAGKCHPTGRSTRRVTCTLAVHRLAMTREAGSGCHGSLALRELTFARSETGRWINEDSIALCGGQLRRRAELFPVAIDGQPRYALRESFEMHGGNARCAAPYLRSRQPLQKTYLPAASQSRTGLRCGIVALR